MTYRIKISSEVRRAMDRLPGNVRQRARRMIAQLAFDPRPDISKALEEDLIGYYRIRLDDYRILYRIEEDEVLVEMIRVTRRSPRTYPGLR